MTSLRRVLTWREGAGLTIAAVLGSGVLILPALTADMAGPAALIAWVAMAVAILPMAVTLGRLAVRWPDAGGIAAYARHAFGAKAGRSVGLLFLGTVPVAAPAATLIGLGYAGTFLHLAHGTTVLLAAGLLAMALLANAVGVKISGRMATAVVIATSGILLTAVVIALPHVRASAFHPWLPHGWYPVGTAFALLYWAFVGWEMLCHLTEEFVTPALDVPRSMMVAVAVINGLYLSVVTVTVGTHTYGPGRTGDGLAQLVGLGLGPVGAGVVVAVAVLITYGTIHTYIAGFSRLVYAQARAGDLPPWFATLHPRFRTPTRVLVALSVPFAVVLVWYGLWPFPLGQLIAWPSAIFITLYVVAMASGWRLLPSRRERLGSMAGGLISLGALAFVGWAFLFPVAIGLAAWALPPMTPANGRP